MQDSIRELDSGVVYRDYDGNELKTLDDIVKFLAEQGINHIRVRVWNDPYDSDGNGYGGRNNDVEKAKEFADTVTIKAVVTLKNGKKKTVSMKLKVK